MQINYQGYLTDDNNIPINDTVKITFKIYDKIEGGDSLWSEIHENVLHSRKWCISSHSWKL